MTLKERLISEIEQLSPEKLIVVQNLVSALGGAGEHPPSRSEGGYLKVREALVGCDGNMSDDVLKERDERL
jgi:hypothetical protein